MTNYDDKKRFLALRRALKMNALFAEPNFDNIMHALGMPSGTPAADAARFAAFETACNSSGILNAVEIEWLWNYLQHVDETEFTKRNGNKVKFTDKDLREAAQTGW